MSKTIKNGSASAQLSGSALSLVDDLLKKVMPKTSRFIQSEFERIVSDAKKDWLIREKDSERSIDKFYIQKRIKQDELVFVIGNSAPYSWAIKVGKKTDSNLKEGTRIANHLLWRPTLEAADEIAAQMAKEI